MPGTQPAVEIAIWRAPRPKPSGSFRQPAGREHRVVVQERLAHAHHDHVRQTLPPSSPACRASTSTCSTISPREQVASQAHRAGGAERAGQRAAGLRRDADRVPVAVAHRHRLDRVPVAGGQPQLDRPVRRLLALPLLQLAQRRLARRAACAGPAGRRSSPRNPAPARGRPHRTCRERYAGSPERARWAVTDVEIHRGSVTENRWEVPTVQTKLRSRQDGRDLHPDGEPDRRGRGAAGARQDRAGLRPYDLRQDPAGRSPHRGRRARTCRTRSCGPPPSCGTTAAPLAEQPAAAQDATSYATCCSPPRS